MSDKQELQVREKKELKEESTHEGAHFTPDVDIFETDKALILVADIPGATNEGIELDLKDNVLSLRAKVTQVETRWKAAYTEYEIGHYAREFRLGQVIDQGKISAQVRDGVADPHAAEGREGAAPQDLGHDGVTLQASGCRLLQPVACGP